MNKKLLSVVIGAALAGSISIAQADVQLYGQVDVSVDSHDCATGGCPANNYSDLKGYAKNDGSQKMNMNGNFSYFGIKGSEDLGNGLKAIFNASFAFDPAGNQSQAGTNSLVDHEKWLGLAGDFGTFRAGTVTTPYSDHGAMIDPFYGTSLEGNKSGLQSYALHDEFISGEFADGLSNRTMRYDSPDMNGLSGSVFYTMGGFSTSTNGDSTGNSHNPYGLGGQYKNGNILAFADYLTSAENAPGVNDKAWDLGGQYTMGNIGMFGMYERGGLLGSGESSANMWHLGGSFKMGNTLLYAAYGQGDAKDPASTENKSKAITVGVKHNLSVRTSVYVGFNQSKVDDTAGPAIRDDHFGLGMNVKF